MNRHAFAGGVAGLCFLACGLIVVLAYLSSLFRIYGPVAREVILATVTPQFAAGAFSGIALISFCAFLFAWGER